MKELIVHPTMETKKRRTKISALIDLGCMHTTITADTI